ncbi:MAG: outer membrane lipoprotein-sorting protein [Methylococcales symbiont of Hymedesmia sp. n. MRB-2018]|nr:MAG: outer membrane lipoprotein-sorting protein [Methylococcales symbiont of Hymedesmia sp. n. MRB-2018]KAF3983246.1 MAG: outer membrane lipoprotein-sorting protein [Methylococcales symbiont of Hymedesmia sp. n. MRB-2018]
MKTLNYQGTVAFFKNGRLDTMKYSHAVDQKTEQERLLSLNSPMREVIRDAGTISCIFNKSKKMIVNHRPVSQSFIVDLPIDFSALNTIYRYSLGEEESVAMRSSQTVFIKPIDQYRYPRKIWIDREHFLPLKVEVYNLLGETLEQVVYTDIRVVDKLKFVKVGKNLDDANITHIHLQETVTLGKTDFILDKQPIGFQMVFFTRMDTGSSDEKVDHLLLSDGFSSVSVYREFKSDDTQLGIQTLGSVNSFTRIAEDYQITAMGDVPVKAVEEIAQGITFQ